MQNGCVFLPVSRSLLVGPIKSSSCNKTDDTLPCVQGTFLDKVLNSFSWFYASHLLMTIAVVTLLVVHPLPGLGRRGPARLNCDGPAKADFGDKAYHGTTWVGSSQSACHALVRRDLSSSAVPGVERGCSQQSPSEVCPWRHVDHESWGVRIALLNIELCWAHSLRWLGRCSKSYGCTGA